MKNIDAMQPENISAETDQWRQTAEGVLRWLLWRIETGQIKPKELVVAYVDYKGGEKQIFSTEATKHSKIKINGLLNLALQRHSDRVLYEDE